MAFVVTRNFLYAAAILFHRDIYPVSGMTCAGHTIVTTSFFQFNDPNVLAYAEHRAIVPFILTVIHAS
ncbi:MAG: hypothetical protein Q4E58_11090 [Prevotellaceae bacterium]|nr:hypothetical protein [Prevotellaceae bacterium]